MIRKTILIVLLFLGYSGFAQPNCVHLESDVYPGSPGGLPVGFAIYNGALYFRATGNAQGAELWKYENGVTSMVADVNPGSGGSLINQLTVVGGNLYFTATTPATGMELFKYDGVSVTVAADIFPGSGGSSVSYLTAIGSDLYFTADDGVIGMEPYKYDGTTATLIGDINPGSADSYAHEFAGAGGNIYFKANHPTYGFELWQYNGVTAIPHDLYPGTTGSDIGEITAIGSKVCFRATNGTQGYELWEMDGTTPVCLDVCTVGPGDFTPWELTLFNNEVYFRGFVTGTGYELWKYDGTTASLAADIQVGAGNAHPNNLTPGASVLYFAANDGSTGNELWMWDGSNATLVGDIKAGSGESMSPGWTEKMVTIGDQVFVIANSGTSGNEVWTYDGTSTYIGRDIVSGVTSSNPSGMIALGSSVFFTADDMIAGSELWVWDLDADLTDSISVTTCGDYTSPGGTLYSGQGVYDFVDAVPSVNCPGCDSLVTVHLVLTDPEDSIDVHTCDPYTSPAGTYYAAPGNYIFTDTISSIACPGFDSIVHVNLNIYLNLNTQTFVFSGVVFVQQAGGNYQWLDCDNNYAPIPGANDQDFIPTVDGNYCCQIIIGSCNDTTDCVFVEAVQGAGLEEDKKSEISVYPNPVADQLTISNSTDAAMSVKIFNLLGEAVYFEENDQNGTLIIDMSAFAKGVYHLEIYSQGESSVHKVIKQ